MALSYGAPYYVKATTSYPTHMHRRLGSRRTKTAKVMQSAIEVLYASWHGENLQRI